MDKLKELLGEELFAQVAEKVGTGRTVAVVAGEGADGSWIPKEKFKEATDEVKTLKGEIQTRDGQLTELRTAAKGNEELTTRITELTEANATTATEHAAALRTAKVSAAVDLALVKAGALNAKAVLPFIDRDKLELTEDGSIKGLDDVVKGLVEGDDTKFLFGEAVNPRLVGERSAEQGGTTLGKNVWKSGEENLDEQTRIYREDPALAKRLMAEAGVTIPE